MGTRGLIGFIIRDKRYGSYNHFDSYPEGMGAEVVAFILSLTEEQLETMRQRVNDLEWVTIPDDSILVPRARLLQHIRDGYLTRMPDDSKFAEDGIFCEYEYLMDFEKRVLEYRGGVPCDDHGKLKVPQDKMNDDGSISIPFAKLKEHWLNTYIVPLDLSPARFMKCQLEDMRLPGSQGARERAEFNPDECLRVARFTVKEYLEIKPAWDQYAREAQKRNDMWFRYGADRRSRKSELAAVTIKFWVDQWTGPVRCFSEPLAKEKDWHYRGNNDGGDTEDDQTPQTKRATRKKRSNCRYNHRLRFAPKKKSNLKAKLETKAKALTETKAQGKAKASTASRTRSKPPAQV